MKHIPFKSSKNEVFSVKQNKEGDYNITISGGVECGVECGEQSLPR